MRNLCLFFFLVLWISTVQGETIYTRLEPPVTSGESYDIDFNNDSVADLTFWTDFVKLGAGCISTQAIKLLLMRPYDTALVFMGPDGELALFENSDTIRDSGQSNPEKHFCVDNDYYKCPQLITYTVNDCGNRPPDSKGHYQAINDRYLGLVLPILGEKHYCWIKVSKPEGVDLTIESFAYNSVPGELLIINDPNPSMVPASAVQNFLCYPNPVKEYLSLELPHPGCQVEIYNASGKLVFAEDFHDSSFTIPVESWLRGIYLISVRTASGRITEKIIKN